VRTGLTKVGLPGATLGLQKEDPTIAELLKPLGYTSNTYYDWLMDHVFAPAQDYVGRFLMTFKGFPQRQKAASFNLDEVLQKLKESAKD
jgi:arylsulfatase A-like enzyme